MNRIILVGNGFDLAHGLKIRNNYTDMKSMLDRVVNKTFCETLT